MSALLWLLPALTFAHGFDPAVLHVQELPGGRARLVFGAPRGESGEPLVSHPELPLRCHQAAAGEGAGDGLDRWIADCEPGWQEGGGFVAPHLLPGQEILVRWVPLAGDARVSVLRSGSATLAPPTATSQGALLPSGQAFRLGVTHVLSGVDHLAFLFCLVLLLRGRRLVVAVTAFTAGHMLTVSAAALGWIRLSAAPMEVLIALSVFGMAVELTRSPDARSPLLTRAPWLATFGFGLVHGSGFAAALRELDLSSAPLWQTLALFNLGVEVGQLAFVLPAAGVQLLLIGLPWPQWAARAPLYGIGGFAAFWTLERTLGLWR